MCLFKMGRNTMIDSCALPLIEWGYGQEGTLNFSCSMQLLPDRLWLQDIKDGGAVSILIYARGGEGRDVSKWMQSC